MKRAVGIRLLLGAVMLSMSQYSLAAGAGPAHFVNVYELVAHKFGFGDAAVPVLGSLLALGLCLALGLYYKASVERSLAGHDYTPAPRASLRMLIEMCMDFVYGLTKEHCGHHYRNFLPLLGGLFIFILVSNLSGLIPGFPPATESFNTNLAMGGIAFLCYNFAGIKAHGAGYIKQFTGPFLILAPLFLCIELVSHAVRPLSLAFRLLANIFCDHLLLSVFTGLVPLVIPVAFLFFGLLVAVIQSFVFTLLTGIYINMAISHDH